MRLVSRDADGTFAGFGGVPVAVVVRDVLRAVLWGRLRQEASDGPGLAAHGQQHAPLTCPAPTDALTTDSGSRRRLGPCRLLPLINAGASAPNPPAAVGARPNSLSRPTCTTRSWVESLSPVPSTSQPLTYGISQRGRGCAID